MMNSLLSHSPSYTESFAMTMNGYRSDCTNTSTAFYANIYISEGSIVMLMTDDINELFRKVRAEKLSKKEEVERLIREQKELEEKEKSMQKQALSMAKEKVAPIESELAEIEKAMKGLSGRATQLAASRLSAVRDLGLEPSEVPPNDEVSKFLMSLEHKILGDRAITEGTFRKAPKEDIGFIEVAAGVSERSDIKNSEIVAYIKQIGKATREEVRKKLLMSDGMAYQRLEAMRIIGVLGRAAVRRGEPYYWVRDIRPDEESIKTVGSAKKKMGIKSDEVDDILGGGE